MSNILLIIGTFLSALFIDVFWTLYIKHYNKYLEDKKYKEKHLSSFYSMMVGFCAWVSYDLSIHNWYLLPILLLGYYCGVYYADNFEKLFNKISNVYKKISNFIFSHIC